MGVVVVLLFMVAIAIPLWHQIVGHNVHRKLLRAVLRSGGPEVPPTAHERKHQSHPAWLRLLINAAWAVYFVVIIALALGRL